MALQLSQIVAAAGLPSDTSEDALLAQLAALKQRADNLQLQLETNAKRQKAEIVNAAVAEGKVLAAKVDLYMGLPLEQLEEILQSIPVRKDITKELVGKGGGPLKDQWTFHDWMKNDPEGFTAMKTSDPTRYNQIISAIGTNPNG